MLRIHSVISRRSHSNEIEPCGLQQVDRNLTSVPVCAVFGNPSLAHFSICHRALFVLDFPSICRHEREERIGHLLKFTFQPFSFSLLPKKAEARAEGAPLWVLWLPQRLWVLLSRAPAPPFHCRSPPPSLPPITWTQSLDLSESHVTR